MSVFDILVHGFNVKDPKETIGKLTPFIKAPFVFNYGWFGLISVLLYNKKEAKKLKEIVDKNIGGRVYAHSNGSAIAVLSAKFGAKINTLVCINPALKCSTVFPESIERIIVIHTRHDRPTKTARFFDKVPLLQLLVPNAWGAMGADGYKGNDKRVYNWNLSHRLEGHSDFFSDDKVELLMIDLEKLIKKLDDSQQKQG